MKTAGFVLTGGQSKRMGRDKALLPVGSQTLCEHIGDVVSQVVEEVWLVGHSERYGAMKYPCLSDMRPGLGPLSGVETVLSSGKAEWNVVTGCDVFNLDAKWLGLILSEAERSGARCVIAQDAAGNWQPLCGVYHQECRAIVSQAVSEGRLRLMDLIRELNAIPVRVPEIILNVNTPDQYAELVNAGRKQPLH